MFKNALLNFKKAAFKISILAVAVFFAGIANAQDVAEGETLFKQNCTSCHAVKRKVVGPALAGARERWPDKALLVKFIQNSQAVIKGGDKYATELYAQYNNTVMPNHGFINDAQVESILAYVDAEAVKVEEVASTGADGGTATAVEDKGISSTSMWTLIGAIALLFGIILVMNRVIGTLERLILQKDGVEITPEMEQKGEPFAGLKQLASNKRVVILASIFFVVTLAALGYQDLMKIGLEQGYQPKQPIAFSHQIHAGEYKINCQYCHSGAYKGKSASIPSANVCMNCHKYVQATEKYDGNISPEIAKIYTALDYNPETQTYGTNPKPIEWVRIHNLQDFVYFPHSQHVKVAGIECQQCHGPVQEMKEVYQFAPLTMGWCINCHKETEMDHAKDNDYYARLIKAHDTMKKGESMTVANIGGLECVKCHY